MASTSKEYSLAIKIAGAVSSSFNSTMSTAESKFTSLGEIASKAAQVAAAAWGALKIGEFISDAIDTYSEFEQAMANTAAIAGATEEEYEALEAAALEMGKSTTKSASECAEALGYMSLAGWSTEDSIASLESVLHLSEATEMDLATCSDLVTDSMSAMGLSVSDLTEYLDICTAANNNANTTSEDFMEALIGCGGAAKTVGADLLDTATAIGILANNGTKGSEAGTALNSILARISSNDAAIEALDQLGISAFDASGEFVGLQSFLEQTQTALADLSTEEQAYYLKQIAGTNYFTEMSYLLDSVAESADGTATAWDTLSDALENSEGSLDAMAASVTDTWEGATARVESAMDDLKINLASTFMPYVTEAANQLAEYIPTVTEAITEVGTVFVEDLIPKLEGVWDAIQPVISTITDGLSSIWETVSSHSGIFDNLGSMASEGLDMISIGVEAALPYLNDLIDTVLSIIEYFTDLGSQIDGVGLLGSAIDLVSTAIETLKPYGQWLWDSFLSPLVSWAGDTAVSMINGLADGMSALADLISEHQTAFEAIVTVIASVMAAFQSIKTISSVASTFTKIKSAVSAASVAFGAINPVIIAVVAAIAAVAAIAVTVIRNWDSISAFFTELWGSICTTVSDAVDSISQFFTNLWENIKGVWNTVSTWFDTNVIQPLINFFSPIVERISAFFEGCWILIQAVWLLVSTWFDTNVIQPLINFFAPIVGSISGFFQSTWDTIQGVWLAVSTWFDTNVIQPVTLLFSGIVESITGFFQGLWDNICEIWQAAGEWFDTYVKEPINAAFQAVCDFVKGIINSLIGYVESLLNSVISAVNSFISGFNSLVNSAASLIGVEWGGISELSAVSLPRLAEGGIVDQPTVLEAGEAGTEAIIPLAELWDNLQQAVDLSMVDVANSLVDLVDAQAGQQQDSLSDILREWDREGTASGGGGSAGEAQTYTIEYKPVYQFSGGTPTQSDLEAAERTSQAEFDAMMKQWMKENSRKVF